MNAYVREYQKIESRTRRRDNFLLRYLPILLLLAAGIVVGKIYLQSVAIRWSRDLIERNEAARDLELRNQELTRAIAGLKARSRSRATPPTDWAWSSRASRTSSGCRFRRGRPPSRSSMPGSRRLGPQRSCTSGSMRCGRRKHSR